MERFCGHSRAIKIDLKLTGKPFRGCTLWPSDPDVKYNFAKFSHAQQETFRVFGFKSDTAVCWTFSFTGHVQIKSRNRQWLFLGRQIYDISSGK